MLRHLPLLLAMAAVLAACATTRPHVVVPPALFEGCFRAHFEEDRAPADDGIYCADKRAFFVEEPELTAREHAEDALLRMEVLAGLPQGALPLVQLEEPSGWRAAHPEKGGVDVFELNTDGGEVALFCTWDERDDGWCKTLALVLWSEGARGFSALAQQRPARSDLVLDRLRWRTQCARGSDQACDVLRTSCKARPEVEGCGPRPAPVDGG